MKKLFLLLTAIVLCSSMSHLWASYAFQSGFNYCKITYNNTSTPTVNIKFRNSTYENKDYFVVANVPMRFVNGKPNINGQHTITQYGSGTNQNTWVYDTNDKRKFAPFGTISFIYIGENSNGWPLYQVYVDIQANELASYYGSIYIYDTYRFECFNHSMPVHFVNSSGVAYDMDHSFDEEAIPGCTSMKAWSSNDTWYNFIGGNETWSTVRCETKNIDAATGTTTNWDASYTYISNGNGNAVPNDAYYTVTLSNGFYFLDAYMSYGDPFVKHFTMQYPNYQAVDNSFSQTFDWANVTLTRRADFATSGVVTLTATNASNKKVVLDFVVDKDEVGSTGDIVIPTGSYTISTTEEEGTVIASGGINQDLTVKNSYAGTTTALTSSNYSTNPLWCLRTGTVTVNADKSITVVANQSYRNSPVNITINAPVVGGSYTVNYGVNIDAGGSITTHTYGNSATNFASGKNDFEGGTSVTLTATANTAEGYRFVKWSNNVATPTITFNVSKDTTLTAQFVKTYTISTACEDEDGNTTNKGSIIGGGTKDNDSTCTLTASSTEPLNYYFKEWKDNNNTNASRTFTVNSTTSATTYTAVFAAREVVNITANGAQTRDDDNWYVEGVSESGYTVHLYFDSNNELNTTNSWIEKDGNRVTAQSISVATVSTTAASATLHVEAIVILNNDTKKYVIVGDYDKDLTPLWGDFKFGRDNITLENFQYDWWEPVSSVRFYAIKGIKSGTTDNYVWLCFKLSATSTYNGQVGPQSGRTYPVVKPVEDGFWANPNGGNYWLWRFQNGESDAMVGWGDKVTYSMNNSYYDYPCYVSSYFGDYEDDENITAKEPFDGKSAIVDKGKDGNIYVQIVDNEGNRYVTIGEPAQPYDLSWDANGGELSGTYTAAGSVNEGASITAPTTTRTGYTFTGWSPSFTGIMPSTNVTYIAQWTKATTLDLYDNQDATYYNNIKALDGQTYDVTYNRSAAYTSDNGNARWYTICLPFNVDRSQLENSGLLRKVYEYRYAEGSADVGKQVTFHFRTATSMVAGQGYLVKATGDMGPDFTFENVTLNTSADVENGNVDNLKNSNAYKESGDIAIVGVLRSGTLSAAGKQVMGLANNKIWYPHSSGNPMPAYRAYFYNPTASPTAMPRVRIVVEGEGTTELEVVDGELYDARGNNAGGDVRAPRKYIRNGVLIIERNGVTYDAQGKRL